jgi:hypothetical protein
MAASSSSSAALAFPPIGFIPVSEKLTRSNYPMWRLQVLSAIRGTLLAEYIKPTATPLEMYLTPVKKDGAKPDDDKESPVPNPDYETWIAKDQQVLNYLLSSLSKEIFSQVTALAETAATAWAAIEGVFASQSRARVISTRMALATDPRGRPP